VKQPERVRAWENHHVLYARPGGRPQCPAEQVGSMEREDVSCSTVLVEAEPVNGLVGTIPRQPFSTGSSCEAGARF
jgi:hypothetical protein